LELEHDPLGRLLADPGDRLEPTAIARGDRASSWVNNSRSSASANP
jgi:hypothetical protein